MAKRQMPESVPEIPLIYDSFHVPDIISAGRYVAFMLCFSEGIIRTNMYCIVVIFLILTGSILYIKMFRSETVSRNGEYYD